MLIQAPVPLALFLLTPFNPALFDAESCLSSVYYGTFDGLSVFRPDTACLDHQKTRLQSASITLAAREPEQLVWVEQKAVEESLKSGLENEFDLFLTKLDGANYLGADDQRVLTVESEQSKFELLYRSQTSALISVSSDTALALPALLPRFYKSIALPSAPVPYLPVPSAAVKRVKYLLSTLKFNPDVASIVNNISVTQMTNDIRWLTGEDGVSGIISRHSFAPGSRVAAQWLKERFEDTGASCQLKPFKIGFAPNVIWYVQSFKYFHDGWNVDQGDYKAGILRQRTQLLLYCSVRTTTAEVPSVAHALREQTTMVLGLLHYFPSHMLSRGRALHSKAMSNLSHLLAKNKACMARRRILVSYLSLWIRVSLKYHDNR
jgi:hypothetical protein